MRRLTSIAVDELRIVLRALRAFRQGTDGSHLPGYAEQILFYLAAQPQGAAGLADLRKFFGLGISRASRLCGILMRAELVEVSKPAEDRRIAIVALTPKGQRLIDRAFMP